MLGTDTATTSTATAPLPALPMSLSSSPETNSTLTPFKESIDSSNATMQPFIPGQCLFCPNSSTDFANNVIHMQKSHGLFIPHQQYLLVDLETLFEYLHLVIFGYRECIHCGTERNTVQAVQQHMTGKGHCTLDISTEDSEFAEFYDFSEPIEDAESDIEGDDNERNQLQTRAGSNRPQKPQIADEDSIRLPSGKIISRKSPAQVAPSVSQLRRRARAQSSQLEYSLEEPDSEAGSSKEDPDPDVRDKRLLSKREKRERATVAYQLANMSANDRNSLMHLPTSQQLSILVTQHRQMEKVQKEERRRQGKVDRKGNKNLYAYWHTETPVYQCG
ncbi:C2H2 type zinc-finger-domain-containing protein [Camillea tinctor]|nr:C2H2 type zinc-finger-domain-containing protein [Camillea tinctor]